MKIPSEAIQAAAVALGQHMRIGVVPTSLASAAIEAAMPAMG